MNKYIWIIYREVIEREDYFYNKDYEIDAYGTETTYEKAYEKGREFLNRFWEPNIKLDLDIQTI